MTAVKALACVAAVAVAAALVGCADPSEDPNRKKKVEQKKAQPAEPMSVDDIQKAYADQVAVIDTDKGRIVVDFYEADAPNTVHNFASLAGHSFYDGLIFHRIIKGFMIQGGCPLGNGTGGPGWNVNAEFNKQKHMEGTMAMARSSDPNSAGSQFYICLDPQPSLDGKYTVFGQVLKGMDVVRAIGDVKTDAGDRPVEPVRIRQIRVMEKSKAEELPE